MIRVARARRGLTYRRSVLCAAAVVTSPKCRAFWRHSGFFGTPRGLGLEPRERTRADWTEYTHGSRFRARRESLCRCTGQHSFYCGGEI